MYKFLLLFPMAKKTDPFLCFIILINLQKLAFSGGRDMDDVHDGFVCIKLRSQ